MITVSLLLYVAKNELVIIYQKDHCGKGETLCRQTVKIRLQTWQNKQYRTDLLKDGLEYEMSTSDSQNSLIDNNGTFSPHINIKEMRLNQLYINPDENYWLTEDPY